MCDYGFSEIECKIICEQIKRRAKYREEFLRLRTDPCKNAQEAGFVFDPAVQRYIAMKANHFDHFYPNRRNITSAICMVVLPFLAYGYLIWNQRSKFLQDCRCGRLRYRDRIQRLV